MRKTKKKKKKGEKLKIQIKTKWEKTENKKRAKTKLWGKRKKMKGRHGPAYYFSCFDAIKKFVSRMKKASNLVRQAKRIESFRKITQNKLAKV